ncbi:farnesylcysteine lyase [Rhododendron vialii]|uniref:farnesylcysteine lyase n=1 Tax=Rhododendron vialii TaxID=182163 RepID=UPI0026605AD1|nr:farnesylcysteine lyase [Rhododendron vialii]
MKNTMFGVLFFSLLILSAPSSSSSASEGVCIIGSGIGGSSVAHFLRKYSDSELIRIRIFERQGVVGGRMATVSVSGETFEAGASILHPKNYHALNFAKSFNLTIQTPSLDSESSFGIWDGHNFLFKTFDLDFKFPFFQKILSLANSFLMFFRYGFSLFRMTNFVETTVDNFLKYYESFESRPVFETVDEMLTWAGLYNLTSRTLEEELLDAGLSPLLIQELVTVITRVNYGQSVSISGLAGAVSLAGAGDGLWSIEGGNWQIVAGLINSSHVELHLREEIESISYLGDHYELNSTNGNSYPCEVTVIATPLDEQNISFTPSISIPNRSLHHTHATFVRGFLNPAYFGVSTGSEIPTLVGTIESHDLPFSSISVLKQHSEKDATYKIFSRKPMADALLDRIFSIRIETLRINWGAYPRYNAPERFAPFVLDGQHLYYVNAFENAASTMETSAVAAENIARLILSRSYGKTKSSSSNLKSSTSNTYDLHSDL